MTPLTFLNTFPQSFIRRRRHPLISRQSKPKQTRASVYTRTNEEFSSQYVRRPVYLPPSDYVITRNA